jgi:hypothetical protein
VGKPYVWVRSTRAEIVANGIMAASAIAVAVAAPSLPNDARTGTLFGDAVIPAQIAVVVAAGILAWQGWVHFRGIKERWIVDDDSIRFEGGDTLIWRCPWDQFGGWRIAKRVPLRDRLRGEHPHEIVDRHSEPIGRIVMRYDRGADMALVKRELERNLPPGGLMPPHPEHAIRSAWSKRKCYFLVVAGHIMFLSGAAMFRMFIDAVSVETADSSWIVRYQSVYIISILWILIGGAIAVIGFMALSSVSHRAILDSLVRKDHLRMARHFGIMRWSAGSGPTYRSYRRVSRTATSIHVPSIATSSRLKRAAVAFCGCFWLRLG